MQPESNSMLALGSLDPKKRPFTILVGGESSATNSSREDHLAV